MLSSDSVALAVTVTEPDSFSLTDSLQAGSKVCGMTKTQWDFRVCQHEISVSAPFQLRHTAHCSYSLLTQIHSITDW